MKPDLLNRLPTWLRWSLTFAFTLGLFATANRMLTPEFRSTPVPYLPPEYWQDLAWLALLGIVYSLAGETLTGVRESNGLLRVQAVVGACVLVGTALASLLGVLDGSKLLLIALGVYLLADGAIRLRLRQRNSKDTSASIYKDAA